MHRKYTHLVGCLILLFTVAGITCAQTGALFGNVKVKQTDGQEAPAGGATVDVFRVDLAGKYSTKTDSKGKFVFAGLPFIGTYLVTVSLPGAKAGVLTNVKVGREVEYGLLLEPGDGKRLSLEEAQVVVAALKEVPTAPETPNQLLARTFKEGNGALMTKNYDEAIKLFSEGLAAFPQQPALLTNLSVTLRSRATDNYNQQIRFDSSGRNRAEIMDSVRTDLRRAVEAANKAVEFIRIESIPEDESDRRMQRTIKYFALAARSEAMRLLVTMVDPSQANAALAAIQEYIDAEEDSPKKSRAEVSAARMLLDSKNYGLAIERYRQILVQEPDNLDALAGFGLALFYSGDRERFPEAAGYLKRFLEQTAAAHPMWPLAIEALKKLNSPQ